MALATATNFVTFRDHASALSLNQVLLTLGKTDIVLVEGFHEEPRPKIEVISDRDDAMLCREDANLIAIVGPPRRDATVPVLGSFSVKRLVDFIERRMLVQA